MHVEKRVSLYFTEGKSDKVYHLQLVPQGDGWMVRAQNGKRGGTLTPRDKTPAPLEYAKALKKYESVLREKTGEGYTTSEDGAVYQNTPAGENHTGIVLQLLNAITPERAAELIEDDLWMAQQKLDGERRAINIDGSDPQGVNRKGMGVALPQALADAVAALGAKCLIDGEIVGEKLHAFDLLELSGVDLRPLGAEERLNRLHAFMETLSPEGRESIVVVETAFTTDAKQRLHDRIKEAELEGVVFKLRDAPFSPGRPDSGGDQLKLKFWESATLEVESISGAKRSVQVRGYDGVATVSLGSVTIAANHDVPQVGALVEVKYLYAYRDGSLAQPEYKGLRTDLDLSACTIGQLKYKPDSQELPPERGPRP